MAFLLTMLQRYAIIMLSIIRERKDPVQFVISYGASPDCSFRRHHRRNILPRIAFEYGTERPQARNCLHRQCSDVSPDTFSNLVTGRRIHDIYDKFCILTSICVEFDFQLDICKEPVYYRTDHFARILGFVMLCDSMRKDKY